MKQGRCSSSGNQLVVSVAGASYLGCKRLGAPQNRGSDDRCHPLKRVAACVAQITNGSMDLVLSLGSAEHGAGLAESAPGRSGNAAGYTSHAAPDQHRSRQRGQGWTNTRRSAPLRRRS